MRHAGVMMALALVGLVLGAGAAQGSILDVQVMPNWNTAPTQAGFENWTAYFSSGGFYGVGYDGIGTAVTRHDPALPDMDLRVWANAADSFEFGVNTPSSFATFNLLQRSLYVGTGFEIRIDGDLIAPGGSYDLTFYTTTQTHGDTHTIYSDNNGPFSGAISFVGIPGVEADTQLTGTFVADASGVISVAVAKGAGANFATLSGISITPEPVTLGLLTIGGVAMLRRRR